MVIKCCSQKQERSECTLTVENQYLVIYRKSARWYAGLTSSLPTSRGRFWVLVFTLAAEGRVTMRLMPGPRTRLVMLTKHARRRLIRLPLSNWQKNLVRVMRPTSAIPCPEFNRKTTVTTALTSLSFCITPRAMLNPPIGLSTQLAPHILVPRAPSTSCGLGRPRGYWERPSASHYRKGHS